MKMNKLLVLLGVLAVLSGTVLASGELFSVNFWSQGKPPQPNVWDEAGIATLQLGPDQAAGVWRTTGWENLQVGPWMNSVAPTAITSSKGSTATLEILSQRNAGPYYWNALRDDSDAVDVGNATLLDAHSNGTESESLLYLMEVRDITLGTYDVIIYLGINQAQAGDGAGKITFNGVERDFTMFTSEPDGALVEIVDETTPGNYLVFEGVSGTSFSVEVRGNGFNHLGPSGIQIGNFRASNPSPAYGEVVPAADPLTLSWTNIDPDPNSNSTATLVDVWFGTDPCTPGAGTWEQVVAGQSVASVDVDASVPGTYYWRVDSNNNDDPNYSEGYVWTFEAAADVAPTVSIDTPDQMTWSGEPVALTATIIDDGASAVTIEWTADPADGVTIVDGDTATPAVAITKAAFEGTVATVTMTVTVYDENNPTPVTDTMQIDVYDSACHMARAGQGLNDATDLNNDCVTNLEDLAVIAAGWLYDYAATGPADK